MKPATLSIKPISIQQKEYSTYSNILFPSCLRILSNRADAEEAMHDTLLHYFTSSIVFASEAQKRSWLFKVAVSKSIDRLRKRETELFGEEKLSKKTHFTNNHIDAITANPGSEQDQTEHIVAQRVEMIKKGVAKLAPGYRTIISLYLFEGYDFEEISSILSITPSTVRSQYIRARAKLKTLLPPF